MPSWWSKSSSKEPKKKKSNKDSLLNKLRKFRIPSDNKSGNHSNGSQRRCSDTVSERGSLSRVESWSASPSKQSKHVARCQSFQERPRDQPLPLPVHVASNGPVTSVSEKPKQEKGSKSSSFFQLSRHGCMKTRQDPANYDGTDSISSECYSDSDDPPDSSQRSLLASDYDTGSRTAVGSPISMIVKDQPHITKIHSKDIPKPRRKPLTNHMPNLQVPYNIAFCSAPDSSISSPSRSPLQAFGTEKVITSAFYAGHCFSPGSGQNSGHNSMAGADVAGIFSGHNSPLPSPRMMSPGPSSRIHSGAVTPVDGKQQSHRLPLPPISVTRNCLTFSQSNSAATSPSVPRSPGSRWKKGKLLGRGSFGHVYVGFNSESGEMCAMKEVTLFSDDAKSKESAKQLAQEVSLLSRLSHPNIVQYIGSEMVDDKLYIYLEYVSGGSIYKLLQDYGQLGELAIRSYTQQILSGLAYLHAKNTIHRDIKGANILVEPNGRVKVADFGMAKHITGQACPLSFKGSPYWMAPEIIKNTTGSNLAVDIWSLGCTVLEMATTKPPWSQYEGVAALFKIGNSKELPAIPDHLSDEGKDFVRQCLQRNPMHRPTAAQLLDHSFVRNVAPLERPIQCPLDTSDPPPLITNGVKSQGIGQSRNRKTLDKDRLDNHSFKVPKPGFTYSDLQIPRYISCPVSPIGSPLLHSSRSPQHINGRISSGTSSPLTSGGGGSISFHHINQSFYLHEISKSTHNLYSHNVPDIFRSKQNDTQS